MSDTDSNKTDRSQQSDLQHKYDKLAMEFAKARMQLNVLKKAYTAKTSQLNQRSVESLDQFENCKYDLISTRSLDLQEQHNKSNQINSKPNVEEELKSKDVKLLRQEIVTMNHHIHRVLDLTKSNTLDYNLLLSEIEYCKSFSNNCSNNLSELINSELITLKSSVTTCLYNILYHKLESRTKTDYEDSRLNFPDYCSLETNCKTDDDKFQKVYTTLIFHFFLSLIINLHYVLECLFKEISPDACHHLQSSLNILKTKMLDNSIKLDNVLSYCEDLKSLKFDTKNIVMENILNYITEKYIDFLECMKNVMDSETAAETECSTLRRNVISFMALKFPIAGLVASGEFHDNTNLDLNGIHQTVHILLRLINIWEFEHIYKNSQLGMHWHMKDPLLHLQNSNQAKDELKSVSVLQNSFKKIIQAYEDKLSQEMNRSLCLEQEKIHWENECKLFLKKNEGVVSSDANGSSPETLILENKLGKCEMTLCLSNQAVTRENELKRYFEEKINDLIYKNNKLSGQSNTYEIEMAALKTQLDHSILKRNKLETKLKEALEYIGDLKDEFHLMSTNYETQLRAMTEHLASLNETVMLERRHIDDLSNQLKLKDKKKSSK